MVLPGGFYSTGERTSQVGSIHSIGGRSGPQAGYDDLREAFDAVDDAEVVAAIHGHTTRGPKGRWVRPLWRAFSASYLLDFDNTNDLIRNLQDNPVLRQVCGFDGPLPHRTTFNRFLQRVEDHDDLVETYIAALINALKLELPDLGEEVAIDSTSIRTHSNPNRKPTSDSDADWGVKHSVQSKKKGGEEYFFGFKNHVICDVKYGIPLAQIVTPANRHDSPLLIPVFRKAQDTFDWFRPRVAIGDRAYGSHKNHEFLHREGIVPIIHIPRPSNADLYKGIYTKDGVPTCLGMVPMEYVRTDENGHYVYRCRKEGCHLLGSTQGGTRHCDIEYAQDPLEDIRLFGVIRRQSPEWKALYGKRWVIEQLFKTQNQSRRLERHCVRGMKRIRFHCLMSTLWLLATALVSVRQQRFEEMRWGVRKVA